MSLKPTHIVAGTLLIVIAFSAMLINGHLRNLFRDEALVQASSVGDVVAVERLLLEGANPNRRLDDFLPPLHYAASNGHIAVVKILLRNGADPLAVNNGESAIDVARNEEIRSVIRSHARNRVR